MSKFKFFLLLWLVGYSVVGIFFHLVIIEKCIWQQELAVLLSHGAIMGLLIWAGVLEPPTRPV